MSTTKNTNGFVHLKLNGSYKVKNITGLGSHKFARLLAENIEFSIDEIEITEERLPE